MRCDPLFSLCRVFFSFCFTLKREVHCVGTPESNSLDGKGSESLMFVPLLGPLRVLKDGKRVPLSKGLLVACSTLDRVGSEQGRVWTVRQVGERPTSQVGRRSFSRASRTPGVPTTGAGSECAGTSGITGQAVGVVASRKRVSREVGRLEDGNLHP